MITEEQVTKLLSKWETTQLVTIVRNRKLTLVDVTAEQLQEEKLIEEDETFIGMKVIQTNINRELPRIFAFLTESSRFLLFSGIDDIAARKFEVWYAEQSRHGAWTMPHLQNYYAAAIHGKSFAEIVCAPDVPLGTTVEYVNPEELIFPPNVTDIQHAGMILRKFTMPVSFVPSFGKPLLFDAAVLKELMDLHVEDLYEASVNLYKLYYRNDNGQVVCRWFNKEINKFLSAEVFHCSGAFDENKQAIPSALYPFVQLRYAISAETAMSMFQGRAVLDEPLQESIQSLTSAYVNGSVRASGFYPYVDENNGEGGATLKQLAGGTLQHNKVASRKLDVFQMNYPDPSLLNAVQLLKTTASNDAGQTDFATVTKRMTNTTATEIQASEQQARLMSSVGVSLMALYMFNVESMRFNIWRNNKTKSASMPPEFLALMQKLVPKSVVDQLFTTRAEKVQNAKNWWPIVEKTPAAIPFLLQLLEEDLPAYAELVKQNMQDSKPVGAAMVALLAEVGKMIPELQQDPNYVKILTAGQQAFAAQPSGGSADAPQAGVEAAPSEQAPPVPAGGA